MNTSFLSLKAAECPVCFETFSEPIYLCDTGHSLCKKCVDLVNSCPICDAPMSNRRNYSLEAVLKELALAAPPEDKYACPVSNKCNFTGNLSQLYVHLQSKHKNKVIVCNSETFTVTMKDMPERSSFAVEHFYRILLYNDKIFKFCIKVDYDQGLVYFAMQMVGDTKDCGYLFEVDYIRCVRKKFVAKVLASTKDENVFRSSFVRMPKILFFTPSNGFQAFGRFRGAPKN